MVRVRVNSDSGSEVETIDTFNCYFFEFLTVIVKGIFFWNGLKTLDRLEWWYLFSREILLSRVRFFV